jgi:hypothetical protein
MDRTSPLILKESTASCLKALIEHFCLRDDLSTYDPYDIWKTSTGVWVKNLYNHSPRMALFPAGALAFFDDVINNQPRWFYKQQEYPIVRAFSALSVLNLYREDHDRRLLERAERHLDWLVANSCSGFSGLCWGLGFVHPAARGLVYDRNTPFSTITPYPLEALVRYSNITGSGRFRGAIESILRFFDKDVQVREEDEEALATSYGPFQDRTVINASSYAMYSYALLLPYAPRDRQTEIERKIAKLYAFVRRHQRSDGSWLYSPEGHSFIDCFHTCIVLKNLIKTRGSVDLSGSEQVVSAGYDYLKRSFLDARHLLFRRFSLKNKPGLVRFDLYDNAEALNLALLLDDTALAQPLLESVRRHFVKGLDVYSQIDFAGVRRNKNTLRWAVMPFLYAASQMV